MESLDSRKRPLDGESDCGVTKRSNQGGGNDNIHLKVLIPAIAGGAIIGKGGETISQIQKETGASVKMSKAQDFYPGTNERVCLIVGTLEAVKNVHTFVIEQIREKPDQNPRAVEGTKINFERHKQVKILVPNSTAGMIIGKSGNYISEIKKKSNAFVQLSQKSKEMNLQERCITIAGDHEQNLKAVDMILEKIADDPQSASCPNISYADYKGPLASANPTGSPFASGTLEQQQPPQRMDHGGGGGGSNMGPNVFSNIGNSMNNLNLNSGQRGVHGGPPGPLAGNPAVEAMRATLRGSGYSEHAIDEIIAAVITLANYGLFGFSLNLGGLGLQQGMGGPGNMQNQNQGGVTLANLANIVNAQSGNPGSLHGGNNMGGNNGPVPNNMGPGPGGPGPAPRMAGNFNNGINNSASGGGGRQGGDGGNPPVFGPVGSTTTTKAGGDTGEGGGSFYANSGPGPMGGGSRMGPNGDAGGMFPGPFSGSNNTVNQGFSGPNQNSFGLGPGIGGLPMSGGSQGNEEPTQKEIEIGEHIIGAVLGPGGKGIVEIQNFTGTNIQISKKGVFAPGTRNRVVTISGTPSGIQNAEYLIRQRTSQEEANRTRQGMRQ